MKKNDEHVTDLYIKNKYIKNNPTLHAEDSQWKINKILPLVDIFIKYMHKDEINILDAGGGTGLILKTISAYTKEQYHIKTNKLAIDLSPDILDVQKKTNPDLKKFFNEDITQTSLADKETDLTLLIDLLEHVKKPIDALKEIQRIAKFAILKVPLERCLANNIINLLKKGRLKKHLEEKLGHINTYNFNALKEQLEKNTGNILSFHFTNVFEYFLNSDYYKNNMSKKTLFVNSIAANIFKFSPKLCSCLFSDFVIILVKCY